MEEKDLFKELNSINVNDYTEQKNGLTYLSWTYAIAEICKRYNSVFSYEIKRYGEKQLPYVYDDGVGFMVFTSITLNGQTRECWLPVMDSKNRAMLKESYEITTKSGKVVVEKATMFDVNKTIMRCLVKNLAMFGLGLYVYAGEDLPETIEEPITSEQIEKIKSLIAPDKIPNMLRWAKLSKIEELTKAKAQKIIESKESAGNEN